MKRLSPAPHLGPPPATQTSYYSESVISESYLGSSRGLAGGGSTAFDDPQDSDSYWGECCLPSVPAVPCPITQWDPCPSPCSDPAPLLFDVKEEHMN